MSALQITATITAFARKKCSSAMTAQAAKFPTASNARPFITRAKLACSIKEESWQKNRKDGARDVQKNTKDGSKAVWIDAI